MAHLAGWEGPRVGGCCALRAGFGEAQVGRVLVYGNSQCAKIVPVRVSNIKKQIAATYHAAFADALPEVRRATTWTPGETAIVVSGDILTWGVDKLQADVTFSDGVTGRTLFTLHFFARMAFSDAGTLYVLGPLWPSLIDASRAKKIGKRGIALGPEEGAILGIASGKGLDLEDLLAPSIGYMLVRGIRGGYGYPEGAEVRFDDVTYIDLMKASQQAAAE